jgi:hypothetical protein
VFLDGTDYIYVGIGGLAGATVHDRNPRSRIIQHAQGRRSGDQFCIYIQDFYVIPAIISKPYEPKKGCKHGTKMRWKPFSFRDEISFYA